MTRITLLKLFAIALLNAGSLGLLWHTSQDSGMWGGGDYFRLYFGVAAAPDWLPSWLHGWFPKAATRTYQMYSKLPQIAVLYAVSNILCVVTLFCIPFIQSTFMRWLIGSSVLALFAYELAIFDISGALPTAEITSTMLINFRFGLEGSIAPYLTEIARNVGFIALLGIPILMQPPTASRLFRPVPGAIFASNLVVIAIILSRQGPGLAAPILPTPFMSAFHLVEEVRQKKVSTNIQSVDYPGKIGAQFEKIIVIMDESVRASYVSTRNITISATPSMRTNAHRFADFGISAAYANCSVDSRRSFRHVMVKQQAAMPISQLLDRHTIWQFAHKAGYRTVHFDAFGGPITPSSEMGQTERGFVDIRIPVMGAPPHTRDISIAQRLRALMHEPGPKFVFVEKYGAHVPYTNSYPRGRNPFGASENAEFNLTDRRELIKHYKNAVNWTVDAFFSELFLDQLPEGVLIVYTSDHGQSLSEGGTKLSHCSFAGKMRPSEAAVPMIAHSTDKNWQERLRDSAKANFNRTSHYNIVPTVLLAMGYDSNWIEQQFGASLFAAIPSDEKRHVRFGKDVAEFEIDDLVSQEVEVNAVEP